MNVKPIPTMKDPISLNDRTATWVPPWGYTEGGLIALGLLTVGFGLQWVGGGLPTHALAWPVNLYVATLFSAALVLLHLFGRRTTLISWLGGIPASLCSITLLTGLILVMGLVLQEDAAAAPWVRRLGLSSMTRSWPFLLAALFFLSTLGLATIKRLAPLQWRNTGYLLNHLGLYVAVLGGLVGSADVERRLMELHEGDVVWLASDSAGHFHEMDLALELIRFEKEEYNPKMAVVKTDTHQLTPDSVPGMFEIETGATGQMLNWQIEVLEFHPLSMPIGDRYEALLDKGSAPAARVRVQSMNGGEPREGWITCGSFAFPHQLLELDARYSLAMTVPRASAYRSRAVLYTPDRDAETITIEVNHPHAVDGWKLYQHSYDDRFGRWSPTSIIELIRDPWLPVVYTGIFMLMIGSFFLMIEGRRPPAPAPNGGSDAAF